MPDYDLNIDGASYNFSWEKPTPPTQADVENAVRVARSSPVHFQNTIGKPRDPGFEQSVADYNKRWLDDNDNAKGSAPYQLLHRAINAPLPNRQDVLPPDLSDVGKVAILRRAYQQAGNGTGSISYTPPAPPNRLSRAADAVGNVLSTPQAYVKAAAEPALKSLYDVAPGVDTRTPADRAEMQRVANLPLSQRAGVLQHQDLRALAQPDKAQQIRNAYQNESLPAQLAESGIMLGTNALTDPLTLATMGTAGLLNKAPLLSKVLTGGFVGAQAAPYVADPSKITQDPAGFLAALPLMGLGIAHLASPHGSPVADVDPNAPPPLRLNDSGASGYSYRTPPVPEPGVMSEPQFNAGAPGRPVEQHLAPADFQRRAADSSPQKASGSTKPGLNVNPAEAAGNPVNAGEAGPGVSLDDYLAQLETQTRQSLNARRQARQPQPAVMPADTAANGDTVPSSARVFSPDSEQAQAAQPFQPPRLSRDPSTMAARAIPDEAAANVSAPTVADVPTNRLNVAPDTFQYKTGAAASGSTGSIPADVLYNPDLAGTLTVWKDAKGEIGAPNAEYVVNGHNRFAKAQSAGVDSVPVRYLDAPDAATARYKGALINIAEGQGTALDAAKVFREKGTQPEELKNVGLPIKGKIAADGLALSKLDDFLYRQVANGSIPETTGAAIGRTGLDHPGQQALYSIIDRAQKAGKSVSPADIEQLAHDVRSAPTATTNTENLFGEEGQTQQNLAIEKAQLASHVKARLAEDQKLFGGLTKQSKAEALARGNNSIDTGENARLAGEAARNVEAFDSARRLNHPGVDAALNDAALQEAQGANKNVVREQLYTRVKQSLSSADTGGEAGRAPGRTGASASGEPGPGSPDLFADHAGNSEAGSPGAAPHPGGTQAAEPTPSGANEPLTAVQKKAIRLAERAQAKAETAAKLDQAEQVVKQRLQKNLGKKLHSGIDPEDLRDITVLAAIKVARGAHTFADFSARMIEDLGEQVRPHLHDLYHAALDTYHEQIAARFQLPRVSPDTERPTPNAQPETPQTDAQRPPQARADEQPQSKPEGIHKAQEGTEPDRTANIRLDNLNTSAEVKTAIRDAVNQRAERIEAARGKVSHAETQQAAKDLGLTPADLKNITPGASAAHMLAVRELLVDSATKLKEAQEAYSSSPTPENQARLQLQAAEHGTILEHVTNRTAEAGRQLAQFKILADAFRGMDKPTPENPFPPVREATNPRSRNFGSSNKLFTADRADAAKARLQQNLSRLNSGIGIDPTLIPDLIEVGGYYAEAGIREFGKWAQTMRAEVNDKLDDATLQHVFANVKAEAGQRVQRQAVSDVFVDQLARRLGKEGAQNFVNAIQGEDGSPETLHKLLSGQELTPEESQAVQEAYNDNLPQRGTPTQQKGAINTVLMLAKEARQEKAVAAKQARRANQPPPSVEQQFESKLKQQLGKAGSEKFVAGIGDLKQKLVNGDALTADERTRIAEAFQQAKRPPSTPAALDQASQALKDIVQEARKTAQEQAKQRQTGPTAAPQTPADVARKLLLADSRANADSIAAKLAKVDPHDVAAVNRIMREETKLPFLQQLANYRRGALLTSPRTIGKIVASHGIAMLADELASYPAAMVDAIAAHSTGQRTVIAARPADLLQAAREGITQGVKEGKLIFQHGEEGARAHGVEPIGSDTREALGSRILTNSPQLDALLNKVFDSHGGAYRPFRVAALKRSIQNQARVIAVNEGLKGQEAADRVQSLVSNPTAEMTLNGMVATEESLLFNPNRTSEALKNLKKGIGPEYAPIADLAIPYPRISSNIVGRMLEHAFGVTALAKPALLKARGLPLDLAAQERFSKTFGRGAIGLGAIALGYKLAQAGILSGNGKERDFDGGSLHLGGRTYRISNEGPLPAAVTLGATWYQLQHEAHPGYKDAALKTLAENPVVGLGEQFFDPHDPTGKAAVGNFAGSFIPTLSADVAAQFDTTTRKKPDVKAYVKNRIPGLRQTLPKTDYPAPNFPLLDPTGSKREH